MEKGGVSAVKGNTMDDSEWTRFVRLRADVDRESAENEATRCVDGRERVELV